MLFFCVLFIYIYQAPDSPFCNTSGKQIYKYTYTNIYDPVVTVVCAITKYLAITIASPAPPTIQQVPMEWHR